MKQAMLLGKELTRQIEVNIRGGQVTIKKLAAYRSDGDEHKNNNDVKKYDSEDLCESTTH